MTSSKLQLAQALGHEMGDKRIAILRLIGDSGSISQAAREAGVSYKAAWQAIETLNNLAGVPLVDKAVGGSGGGGARLTPAALRLLQASDALQALRRETLSRFEQAPGAADGNTGLAAQALRTSMRNQFPCEVLRLQAWQGLLRVSLGLPGGGTLCSRITRESAELLSLRPGAPVLALCKATAVLVAPVLQVQEGRNLLQGRVRRASQAAAGGEAVLVLPGAVQVVGFLDTPRSLRVGMGAAASVDESAVVIALAG
jgi:molybdate transport system regulatory protein